MSNVDEADVRLLLQMVIFYEFVMGSDGVITKESWSKQFGPAERAALQRLIDVVKV